MKRTWAISGVDLHVDIVGPRARAGLEAALREAVQSGRLAPHTRLPSSRALAADLGVARNTVADAYSQLVAEGWLSGRTGAGTWVAGQPARSPGPPDLPPGPVAPFRYDLRPGVPDASLFPRPAWLRAAARKVLGHAPDDVLGYPGRRGASELRVALAGYLARARGVIASPERIVVCAGFTHGLWLLCQVLRARGGGAIVVEAYGHRAHRDIAEASGLRVVPVPVDERGATVDRLGDAGAVLLTPAHQFPLGMTLHPQRRREVVEWATGTSGLVIEDDYDGEFRYDRQPVGAMQALAPEHVIYAGTSSKSLAPGLRLGWLVLPSNIIDEVLAAMGPGGGMCPSLEQLTLAEMVSSGAYDRQVRRARLVYRRRRDRLAAVLQDVPGVRVGGIAAGLHALVRTRRGNKKTMWSQEASTAGSPSTGSRATAPRESSTALRSWSVTGDRPSTLLPPRLARLRDAHVGDEVSQNVRRGSAAKGSVPPGRGRIASVPVTNDLDALAALLSGGGVCCGGGGGCRAPRLRRGRRQAARLARGEAPHGGATCMGHRERPVLRPGDPRPPGCLCPAARQSEPLWRARARRAPVGDRLGDRRLHRDPADRQDLVDAASQRARRGM